MNPMLPDPLDHEIEEPEREPDPIEEIRAVSGKLWDIANGLYPVHVIRAQQLRDLARTIRVNLARLEEPKQ